MKLISLDWIKLLCRLLTSDNKSTSSAVILEFKSNRPFQMRAWSCVTSYFSPLRGSHCHMLDTVNPAMGMILCSSMLAFEKVYAAIQKSQINQFDLNKKYRSAVYEMC